MNTDDLAKLNKLELGWLGENLFESEFVLRGYQVFRPIIDDRGIDLVIHRSPSFWRKVQVKSIREHQYVYARKKYFDIRENNLLALTILGVEENPSLFLFPASAWLEPSKLLVGRDYPNGKSEPEWGINISRQNWPLLQPYRFDITLRHLSNIEF